MAEVGGGERGKGREIKKIERETGKEEGDKRERDDGDEAAREGGVNGAEIISRIQTSSSSSLNNCIEASERHTWKPHRMAST
jgi:hypothetical protein